MANPYDQDWHKLAARFRRANPHCAVAGCRRKAYHVDHILTVRTHPHLRLEWGNLQSLCHTHHSALTSAYDRGSIRGACDIDGSPIDPSHPWAQANSADAIDTVNQKPRVDPEYGARLKRDYVKGKNGG